MFIANEDESSMTELDVLFYSIFSFKWINNQWVAIKMWRGNWNK